MNVISVYTGLKQYIKVKDTKTTKAYSTKSHRVSIMATLTMLPCQSCQQLNHKMETFLLLTDFPKTQSFVDCRTGLLVKVRAHPSINATPAITIKKYKHNPG